LLDERALAVLEKDVFANSLIGATMQDGGKRERSDELCISWRQVAHRTIKTLAC